MSRFTFGTIDPDSKSGTQLATDLEGNEDAVHSNHKGSGAPAYVQGGMLWVDDTTPTEWVIYFNDGTSDREIFRVRPASGVVRPRGLVAGDDVSPPITTEGYQLFIDTSDANDKLLIRRGDDSQWETIGELDPINGWTPYAQGTPFSTSGLGAILGEIRMYSTGAAPPTGWLPCDGAAISTTTYSALFALLGTTWNTGGEPAGTFRVPDLQGRSPVGEGAGSGLSVRNIADTGGEEAHALTSDENGPHVHGVTDPGHFHTLYEPPGAVANAGYTPDAAVSALAPNLTTPATTGLTVDSSGLGDAHETMHPFAVVQYIIRAEP